MCRSYPGARRHHTTAPRRTRLTASPGFAARLVLPRTPHPAPTPCLEGDSWTSAWECMGGTHAKICESFRDRVVLLPVDIELVVAGRA
jgi:hypothetical protein